jgi:hypothetical protein
MSTDSNPIRDAAIQLGFGAQQAGLPHLIIGGNAVNHYGVARFTRDVDFLVPVASVKAWREHLENAGYKCYHAAGAFLQFEAPQQREMAPVDLMAVDPSTWEKLSNAAESQQLDHAYLARWPSPIHLIALKLHAWRGEFRHTREQDWEDVVQLVRRCKIDLCNTSVREIISNYGGSEALDRLATIEQSGDS